MVYPDTVIVQLLCDAPVAIPTVVKVEYDPDTAPYIIVAIRLVQAFQVIIECCSGHLYPVQHVLEGMSFTP
jgi:hypothetical protein